MTDGRSILVVDDDDNFRERLSQALQRRDYEVLSARNSEEALTHAQHESPEWAVVDLRLAGEWGLHVVKALLEIDPATRIVVLTAYGSIATALEAVRLGAVGYLQKPATVGEIERAFAQAAGPAAIEPPPSEVPSLARTEWEHINRVLAECDGNIRQAARLLGLHRRTLQRKLSKFPVKK